jgi:hypothetical protein
MSRLFKKPTGAVSDIDIVSPESSGFLDIVSKFGPLVIAIIAVAFCFYIYKKVNENCNFELFKLFIEEQTTTNYKIQDSYNSMVEQFNTLSNIVHSSTVQKGTIETALSPSSSNFIPDETELVHDSPLQSSPNFIQETNNLSADDTEQVLVDDNSDISFVSKSESSKKTKRSKKIL